MTLKIYRQEIRYLKSKTFNRLFKFETRAKKTTQTHTDTHTRAQILKKSGKLSSGFTENFS